MEVLLINTYTCAKEKTKEKINEWRIKEHYENAKKKLKEAGYSNIDYKLGDGSLGWTTHAPYDRIMVTAAAKTLPEALVEQLAPEGKNGNSSRI